MYVGHFYQGSVLLMQHFRYFFIACQNNKQKEIVLAVEFLRRLLLFRVFSRKDRFWFSIWIMIFLTRNENVIHSSVTKKANDDVFVVLLDAPKDIRK